jgi:hypothetical protein
MCAICIAFVLALPAAGVVGCDDEVPGGKEIDDVTPGSYVGKVEGTDAYIGLVYDGEQVGGYVTANGQASSWLEPSDVSADEYEDESEKVRSRAVATLVSRQGDELGDVTLSPESLSGGSVVDSAATGEVEVDGRPHGFEAKLTEGVEGLFVARRGEIGAPNSIEVGWVVLEDGTQRGSTQLVDPAGSIAVKPAPPLPPSKGGLNAVRVDDARLRPTKVIEPANLDR